MPSVIYTNEYHHFTQRLKQARIKAGLTQQETAKRLKKRQTYISKCEQGERRIDVLELKKFSQLYKQPLTYFLP
jgi:transcriptional regulator with XRE-family HTH domain